jgi:hypothetical protein
MLWQTIITESGAGCDCDHPTQALTCRDRISRLQMTCFVADDIPTRVLNDHPCYT